MAPNFVPNAPGKSTLPTLDHWVTWKQKCALALCPYDTQSELQSFARSRYHRYTSAYAHMTNTPDASTLTPAAPEAWHWFETYLRLHNSHQGKSFKEWLFARAAAGGAPSLDDVQSGASLLMRDVVRERLRHEFSGRNVRALDAPLLTERGHSAPSLLELLPGTLDTAFDVERRELEAIADAEAGTALAALAERERLVLLARELGLAVSHATVITLAGCGKSRLLELYHSALWTLAEHVRTKYPGEDGSTLALLTTLVFERVRPLILLWGKAEIRCARLFMIVEQRENRGAQERKGTGTPYHEQVARSSSPAPECP